MNKQKYSKLTLLLLLVGWLTPVNSYAVVDGPTPTICDSGSTTKCTRPIIRGEVAPFDGQLLTPEKAIELGQKANDCNKLISIESERLVKTSSITIKSERREHQIDINVRDREIEYWKQRTLEAEAQPFYVKPVFVATVTAALTIVAVVVATEAMKAAAR